MKKSTFSFNTIKQKFWHFFPNKKPKRRKTSKEYKIYILFITDYQRNCFSSPLYYSMGNFGYCESLLYSVFDSFTHVGA